jgi:hypothetical protein
MNVAAPAFVPQVPPQQQQQQQQQHQQQSQQSQSPQQQQSQQQQQQQGQQQQQHKRNNSSESFAGRGGGARGGGRGARNNRRGARGGRGGSGSASGGVGRGAAVDGGVGKSSGAMTQQARDFQQPPWAQRANNNKFDKSFGGGGGGGGGGPRGSQNRAGRHAASVRDSAESADDEFVLQVVVFLFRAFRCISQDFRLRSTSTIGHCRQVLAERSHREGREVVVPASLVRFLSLLFSRVQHGAAILTLRDFARHHHTCFPVELSTRRTPVAQCAPASSICVEHVVMGSEKETTTAAGDESELLSP